jgi:hypothetical protein
VQTLKAEIACGMDAKQMECAKNLDENWQTSGPFAVVLFGSGISIQKEKKMLTKFGFSFLAALFMRAKFLP